MKNLKIALISSDAMPTPPREGRYGGLERVTYELAKGLAAKGHRVTLYAAGGSKAPDGVWLIEINQVGALLGEAPLRIKGVAEAESLPDIVGGIPWDMYDVVHGHDWQLTAWQLAGRRWSDKMKTSFIHTWHGPEIGPVVGWRTPPPNLTLVGVSQAHAFALGAEVGGRVRTVYNGVDLDAHPLYEGPRRGLVYMNRLGPEKGVHLAMAVAGELGMELTVIGPEHFTSNHLYTLAMLKRMDGRRVKFLGNLGQEEKVHHLSRAAALLWTAPSFFEPFGLGMVEAMACGTPVVGYGTGAMQEIIHRGGRLASTPSQVIRGAQSLIKKPLPPRKVRENAGRFTAQNMVDAYEKLYLELVKGHRPNRQNGGR